MSLLPPSIPRGRVAVALLVLVALLGAGVALLVRRPAALPAPASPSAPPPPPPWTHAQVDQLLRVIDDAGADGLRPADYKPEAIRQALDAGKTGPVLDTLADTAAAAIAHDFAAGRIRHRRPFNWYIDYAGPDAHALHDAILASREGGTLDGWLRGLLPQEAPYRALKAALADAPAGERRDRIRVNMERWRWLPRDILDGNRLTVNLPTYRLDMIRAGQTVASYRVVIGATDMPTPALSAAIRQVIANPSWIVPPSIVKRSKLTPGSSSRYLFTTLPNGTLRVRQKPGPGNALGKVKIEFPNSMAIYFHDTPAKALFEKPVRAFSHGCVRVQHVEALAAALLDQDPRFAAAMAGEDTRSFKVAQPWRANILYLTMVEAPGGGVDDVGDPYGLDPAMAAALDGRRYKVPDRAAPTGP